MIWWWNIATKFYTCIRTYSSASINLISLLTHYRKRFRCNALPLASMSILCDTSQSHYLYPIRRLLLLLKNIRFNATKIVYLFVVILPLSCKRLSSLLVFVGCDFGFYFCAFLFHSIFQFFLLRNSCFAREFAEQLILNSYDFAFKFYF